MKLALVKGATSYRSYVFVQNSSVTTGAGLTGLVFNSAGLTAYYVRPGAAATAITLATQTVSGAYSSGGFVEIDATNMPGLYRFDVPDAVLATGVDAAVVHLKGATNMVPVVLEVQLTDFNLNSTSNNVGTATAVTTVNGLAANVITAASINAAALNGKGDWNIGKTGYALSAAGVQAVWDALTTALTTAGSIGKLIVDNLNATVSSRSSHSAADVWAAATRALTDKVGFSIAAGGIGSGAHAAAELNAIADAVLDRNMATGTDSGTNTTVTRTPRQALRALRNKVGVAAGTMTVTKEDDVTTSWTAGVTTTAGNPLSELDPA